MRFAANAEKHKDIRTKEQKCFKTYGHGLASMCPQEQKGYAVTTMSVINKKSNSIKRYGVALMSLGPPGR